MAPDAEPVLPSSEILCVGEIVWDALAGGLFLGGAPLNVACHLRAAGLPTAMVSRVGDDRLGEEALRRMRWFDVAVDLVQQDTALPTGFVRVDVGGDGGPAYEILAPAAWDAIAPTDLLLHRAERARAIVFGTLAQRSATTRATIERLWSSPATMVLDVNLRPPYDDREIVARSLERADVVKLSLAELERIAEWFGLRGDARRVVTALADEFRCDLVCVTRGAAGAALWHHGAWTEHPGFEVDVRDTVGAGDAFLAELLRGLLAGHSDPSLLERANRAGATVATRSGALPPMPTPGGSDSIEGQRTSTR